MADTPQAPPLALAQDQDNVLKRKRSSPSLSSAALPPQKTPKTTNAVQINYLARQSPQDLPLLNKNDPIPAILDVLSAYTSVLDRHESLASNLGARPLGPILIKRFERCFDGPPDIIASHSHARENNDAPQVTWLEVIQFAQTHPVQFTLSTFSEGRRVCQFYYPQKQVRVQVTEEDFLFIKSGRCQDLIPPLPIWEDEEKEVGTCEILEKQLRELTNAADTVAARTRQLSHRLKGRRMAIMERRAGAAEGGEQEHGQDASSDPYRTSPTGASALPALNGSIGSPALNSGQESTAPLAVRAELLKHFQSLSQNQTGPEAERRASFSTESPTRAPILPSMNPIQKPLSRDESAYQTSLAAQARAATTPSQMRPDQLQYYLAESDMPPGSTARLMSQHGHSISGSKHNFSRPLAPGQEMSQPYRTLCQTHMESLPRGARVMPPCDRCRRLKMDCLKNLTSCQGCTKKHARCHWKEVGRAEVEGLEGFATVDTQQGDSTGNSGRASDDSEDEGMAAVEDLEALERDTDEADYYIGHNVSLGYNAARQDPHAHPSRVDVNKPNDVFGSSLPYDHAVDTKRVDSASRWSSGASGSYASAPHSGSVSPRGTTVGRPAPAVQPPSNPGPPSSAAAHHRPSYPSSAAFTSVNGTNPAPPPPHDPPPRPLSPFSSLLSRPASAAPPPPAARPRTASSGPSPPPPPSAAVVPADTPRAEQHPEPDLHSLKGDQQPKADPPPSPPVKDRPFPLPSAAAAAAAAAGQQGVRVGGGAGTVSGWRAM